MNELIRMLKELFDKFFNSRLRRSAWDSLILRIRTILANEDPITNAYNDVSMFYIKFEKKKRIETDTYYGVIFEDYRKHMNTDKYDKILLAKGLCRMSEMPLSLQKMLEESGNMLEIGLSSNEREELINVSKNGIQSSADFNKIVQTIINKQVSKIKVITISDHVLYYKVEILSERQRGELFFTNISDIPVQYVAPLLKDRHVSIPVEEMAYGK